MELAPSDFLSHSIKVVLTKSCRSLRMVTTVANASARNINTPAGCTARLSTMLKGFFNTTGTQERLREAMVWYQLQESSAKLAKAIKVVPLTAKTDVKGEAAGAPPAGSPTLQPLYGEHF